MHWGLWSCKLSFCLRWTHRWHHPNKSNESRILDCVTVAGCCPNHHVRAPARIPCENSGRVLFAYDRSTTSRACILPQPGCGSSFWSCLDTLAYPTLMLALSQIPSRVHKWGLCNRDGVSGRAAEVAGRVIGTHFTSPETERFMDSNRRTAEGTRRCSMQDPEYRVPRMHLLLTGSWVNKAFSDAPVFGRCHHAGRGHG